jgi:hypothetical protein
MFSNNSASPFIEATVHTVDIKRHTCKCVTERGQTLPEVGWFYQLGQHSEAGSSDHPTPGERVLLVPHKNQLMIIASCGMAQRPNTSVKSSISGGAGSEFYDRFNPSILENGLRREGSMPIDTIPGDKVIKGDRNNLIAVLKGGSVIAKASALSQIVLSKLDDLVRIVSRNYEFFSDSMVNYSINLKGRTYSYLGWFKNQSSSRRNSPDFYEVLGDTSAGESAKADFLTSGALPSPDNVIKYQRIPAKDAQGDVVGSRWLHTYSLDGTSVKTSLNEAGDINVKVTQENGHYRVEVTTPSGVSSIDAVGDRILATVGTCTIDQTPTQVIITAPDEATINTKVATINATTSTTVTTPIANVNATTSITLAAPQVIATTPAFSIAASTGTANVSISNANINAVACTITGDAASDVIMDTISLKNHTHTSGSPGNPTSTPDL